MNFDDAASVAHYGKVIEVSIILNSVTPKRAGNAS